MSGRHNLRAVLGNSTWLFMDKILRMGFALVIGVWVARYLGPERFGLLNYTIAYASLFGAIAALGLDGIVIRELVTYREKSDVILGSAFALKVIGSSITFVIAVATIAVLRRGETLTLWLVALAAGAFVFQSLNVIDLVFQSRVQSQYTVYATNGAFLLMSLTKIVLLLVAAPLIAFGWTGLGEAALAAVFLMIAYRAKSMTIWKWRASLPVMRNLLKASWPLMLSGISISIATRIDQVLIGQMLNDRQVGLYSVAARVAEIWYFIPIGIAGSAFPLLIESKKQSEELYYQRLQKLYTPLVLLAIAVSLAMTFLSTHVIRLLYGATYAGSARVLTILIWSGVPISFGCIWSNWMLIENRTKMMFFFQANAAIVNIILNIILIPRFGIMGSAYATLISYSVGHTILAAVLKSQHKALAMLGKAVFPFWSFFQTNSK